MSYLQEASFLFVFPKVFKFSETLVLSFESTGFLWKKCIQYHDVEAAAFILITLYIENKTFW